ncbi:hypothetical protein CNMCM8980_009401 [Aspergillus fumigatiaffinis]|uniref:Zn(2)-C6 fungal-type domain-containing protein n=1 Tax=Aspergillus fumigatiaffinis TaxID=340414 RepID=A0A8H4H130_9EURO|nr:hypothetical protein CNMCM5878_004295 [Aspergillus fumigatiaffinis]KAF4224346.1 hypothetical protein CNMCM6457_009573 [Aspergillus fumigatiaffinis]KAF4232983.1 hypothetical protein CNMCM6805_009606 [Aspergillus fumigatiaffinis]KAF4245715.1 hypothetical protein CNMCM8980_009401 [Aspergillus fumigatiaffinis]
MLSSRTASACDNCRLRRRRCDRTRPKCSYCISQGVECIYSRTPDSQPSRLVQELMSIRKRLESITPLLEQPQVQLAPRGDNDPPVTALQNCPPLVLKSPHLMQILGLQSDLASVLYRLENTARQPPVSLFESTPAECFDLILRRVEERIHPWYPVLHSEFTTHFFEACATGFIPSTISCLSHLVIAVSSLIKNSPHSSHFEAALSMMGNVMHECSVTSVQCLILFGVYQAYLIRPRQAYEYVQAAFLKIQPFLKSPSYHEETPEAHLVSRLYWTIYILMSETYTHLNLSLPSKTLRGQSNMVTLPSSNDMWSSRSDQNAPSNSSLAGIPQEVDLQQALDAYATSGMAASDIYNGVFSTADEPIPNEFPDTYSAVHRAKYHMYEVNGYWPVIYRIILNGSADPELLPYGPLFFESVTAFLSDANMALWICRPKAWFLCASIYTISMATLRATDVQPLRLLVHKGLWEQLQVTVDALQKFGELSPSVRYMWDSLRERLSEARS